MWVISFGYMFLLLQVIHIVAASSKTDVSSTYPETNRLKEAKRVFDCVCEGSLDFKCDSGEQCISRDKVCDGKPDCLDSSDESAKCRQIIENCPSFAFMCAYGACVQGDAQCNGIQECADNSDERPEICHGFRTTTEAASLQLCGSDEFTCTNGQCIQHYALCDGVPQCSDRSDESYYLCRNKSCPPLSYRCAYGACAHQKAKCNGIVDCADKSDEAPELCDDVTTTESYRSRIPQTRRVCVLPQAPHNGRYTVRGGPARSSQALRPVPDGTYIVFSCSQGYRLTHGYVHFTCDIDRWAPNLDFPSCVAELKTKSWTQGYNQLKSSITSIIPFRLPDIPSLF